MAKKVFACCSGFRAAARCSAAYLAVAAKQTYACAALEVLAGRALASRLKVVLLFDARSYDVLRHTQQGGTGGIDERGEQTKFPSWSGCGLPRGAIISGVAAH